MGDHGEATHGLSIYQSVLHVPLLIRAPGLEPRRVAQTVSLIDVYPTVIDLLGMPALPNDGRTLVPAMRGVPGDEGEIYAESLYPLRMGRRPPLSLRAGRNKLIEGEAPALFDLERDPFETRSLHAERAELAVLMRQRLAQFAGPRQKSPTLAPVSRELRERLAALGYVSREVPRPRRSPGER